MPPPLGADTRGTPPTVRAAVSAPQTPEPWGLDGTLTRRDHGIESVVHRGSGQSLAVRRAPREADGLALAGGVIRSEASPWNILFHTSRLRAAGASCLMTVTGIGHRPLGHSLSRRSLRRFGPIVVRDADSAERLHHWRATRRRRGRRLRDRARPGTRRTRRHHVRDPAAATQRGACTTASDAKRALQQGAALDRLAREIDEAAAATGLRPRFVAFQASRDSPLHEEVARRLAAPAEVITPTVHDVLTEVGRSRMVVTMRYHGAVAALPHSPPAVLLNCSLKLASLTSEGERWAGPRSANSKSDD